MTVTVYRWDDPSAPVLIGQAGSFTALLDACLVDGYGAKTAAGWTKAFSGTNKVAYRQGAGSNSFYLRVDNSAALAYARCVGYEAMSDVDTGTNAFPTNTQLSGGIYWYYTGTYNTDPRAWILVADSKRFYFWANCNEAISAGLVTATAKGFSFFGDIISYMPNDAYATAILGNSSTSTEGSYLLANGGSNILAGNFMARSYTQTGTSIGLLKTAGGDNGYPSMGLTAGLYPSVGLGVMLNCVTVGEYTGSLVRGRLPGLWNPFHSIASFPQQIFQGTGPFAGRTFIKLPRIVLEISDTWESYVGCSC